MEEGQRGESGAGEVSVSHDLRPHLWSNEETAAYEAAIEAVNGAVGAYSALISAERAKPRPDTAVIEDARSARGRLAREREQLRADDHEQIAQARLHYAELADQVRARTTS